MKQFFSLLLLIFVLIGTNSLGASMEVMIGQVDNETVDTNDNETSSDENEDVSTEELSDSSDCDCGTMISNAKEQMTTEIEDYVDANIKSFDNLIKQLKKNRKEMRNRTNNIEDDKYYIELKNSIQKATKNTNTEKHKLMGYKNILLFSDNGAVEKEDKLKSIYSLIKTLEFIESSLEINKETAKKL